MDTKEQRSIRQIVRILHRDVGFLILGFVLIYSVSGITLIYRDSEFMKQEKTIISKLPPETKPEQLGTALKIKEFKTLRSEGAFIYFKEGSFNTVTGEAVYKIKELIFPFNKLAILHKTPSKNPFHWFTLVFGILLMFMAVSSFWMFNRKPGAMRSGIIKILAGLIFAVLLLSFLN